MSDIKLPDRFVIPEDRIPKPWSQSVFGLCGYASATKVLEVWNYRRTGVYTMLSKFYTAGRHASPNLKNFKYSSGIDYEYTMNSLLTVGSVPEEMWTIRSDIPYIIEDVMNHPNLAEFDKVAEKTKIKSFTRIPGNAFFRDNVKKYLYGEQMPLIGNITGEHHCMVIVGWDGKEFLCHDHDGSDRIYKKKCNDAYALEGYLEEGIEERTEEKDMPYKLIDISEFKDYLDSLKVTRKIKVIQLHHTYSPSYKQFKGDNHIALQNGMRNYHVNTNGWNDIAQQFTIFPDGKICTGRDINVAPAGIKGANSNGICIECLGNFDIGGDEMTNAQRNSIIGTVKVLLDKFGLDAENDVTYHAWWSSDGKSLGDYYKMSSAKTCPGTNFFGGNTRGAYRNNLMPLIKNAIIEDGEALTTTQPKEENNMDLKPVTEINDIVWELTNAGIVTDGKLWLKKCEEDINVYWLCRKMANKIRGTLE